jgi:sortase A
MLDRSARRWELAFFVAGAIAALIFLALCIPPVLARVAEARPNLQTVAEEIIPHGSLAGAYLQGTIRPLNSSVIGTIRIPGLDISAPMIEGISDEDLRRGVGHVPGSALGGGLGNVILAAHRDHIFRPLRNIARGMDIQLIGSDGVYHYLTDSTEIVTPEHLEVMSIDDRPSVTLITCYPFDFIGAAPKRFIVKAHLVSVSADPTALPKDLNP